MTPLPKRRWSTHRQGRKRSTFKTKTLTSSKCSNCGSLKESHAVCPKCGYYRGKQVIKIKEKKIKEKSKVENQE